MKIIFDCGSTKTAVAVIYPSRPTLFTELTGGYNAMSGGDDELFRLVSSDDAITSIGDSVSEVFFYGAGCATPQACDRVRSQIGRLFPHARCIEVESDMLGAARAVCGHSPGIVGILGTGSNSCAYDGCRITANVSPLGYILGDEGSGAVLGRLFLGRLLKGRFPDELRRRFDERFNLSVPEIITRVYREPRPNAFLASFAPFIAENAGMPQVSDFLLDEFSRYVSYNLMNYPGFPSLPVHLVGSIAEHFRSHITAAVNSFGGQVGNIVRAPLPGLVRYHKYQKFSPNNP